MIVKLIGFNLYKAKDGTDRAEVHLVTDLPMKNGCQVMIARIPYDPFVTLDIGQDYEATLEVYTYNGEMRSRISGLKQFSCWREKMKVFNFIIIFTTIFSLVFSLSLSVSAVDEMLDLLNVSLFPTHPVSFSGIEVYNTYQQAIDNTMWPTIELPSGHRDYDRYIVFELIDASGNTNIQDDYYDSLLLEFSAFYKPDAQINRIKFAFSLIGSENEQTPRLGFNLGNVAVDSSEYTVSFTRRDFGWIENKPEAFYCQFFIDVLFDNPLDLSNGITLVCDYDFINPGNHEYFQIMGVDLPVVSYSSVFEYVEEINSDVKVITDVTKENNQVLKQIFSSIESADPETSAKLDGLSGSIVDVNTNLAVSEEQIERIYNHYVDFNEDPILESDSWEWILRTYHAVLGQYGDSEFASFWYGIWSNAYISVFIMIAIGFAAAYFALHNLG